MTQQTSEFMALAGADASLMAQLETAASAAEVVRIAKARGFDISESDVDEVCQPSDVPLGEAELAGVAGGMMATYLVGSCFKGYNHNETLVS